MPFGWSKTKSPFASHRKSSAKTKKETPHSDGMTSMASQVGNSGMAELLSPSSSPSQAVQPFGSAVSQELDQVMRSRADSLIHRGAPQGVHSAPAGLDLDLDAPVAVPGASGAGNRPVSPNLSRLSLDLDQPVQPAGPASADQGREPEDAARPTSPNLSRFNVDLDEPVQNPTVAPASQEQAPAEGEAAKTPAESGEEKFGTFVSLREQLLQSEKGGIGGNSARFNAVDHSIGQVVGLMNQPLSGEPQKDQETFNGLVSAYARLLEACDVYTKRSAHTSSGKARQDIVRQIKSQAEQDFSHLRDFSDRMSSLPPEQRPKNMVEALGMARTRVLTLKEGKESDLKHVGGAVSYIGVLETGSLTDEKASGFFKKGETFDLKQSDVERYIQNVETLAKRKPEYRAIADAAASLARETGKIPDMYRDEHSPVKGTRQAMNFSLDISGFSDTDREVQNHFKSMLHSHYAAHLPESLPSARLRQLMAQLPEEMRVELPASMPEILSSDSLLDLLENFPADTVERILPNLVSEKKRYADTDQTVRVSDRNVATSRMANLLGIGDLVAQSERVELHDAVGKGVQQGNLMQKARGKEVASFFGERLRDEAIANADASNLSHVDTSISPQAQQELIESAITPEFMQSLTSLQVLDSIIGQCDRHHQNYFASVTDDGKLGRVQGIDNDFAFGFHSLRGQVEERRLGNFGHKLVDEQGKLRLPHMDRKLADRILALRENDVRLMLADVLEDWAIDSLCMRISEAQEAIRNDQRDNPDSGRYLDDVSQWDAKVMEDLRGNECAPTTYVGDLLAAGKHISSAMLPGLGNPAVEDLLDKLRQEKREQLWAGIAGAEDKAEYLKAHGVKDVGALQYVAAHGGEFTGSPEELSSPDVSWVLSGRDVNATEVQQAFIAEQERIKRSRSRSS